MATQKKVNNYKKYIKWFWGLYFTGLFIVMFIFFLASQGVLGYMPTFETLENPESNLASQIFSEDGKTIGKFYLNENRTPIRYDELSPYLPLALVSTEDERYYEHSGIDFRSLIRAIAYLGKKGGGSTVTQQFAKLLFNKREEANFIQKINQKNT
jgi:penicillin-binding protein 1A